jgi:hypothetical protein
LLSIQFSTPSMHKYCVCVCMFVFIYLVSFGLNFFYVIVEGYIHRTPYCCHWRRSSYNSEPLTIHTHEEIKLLLHLIFVVVSSTGSALFFLLLRKKKNPLLLPHPHPDLLMIWVAHFYSYYYSSSSSPRPIFQGLDFFFLLKRETTFIFGGSCKKWNWTV